MFRNEIPMRFITLISVLLIAITVCAQVPAPGSSPAQDRIEFATRQIAKSPQKPNLYVELATALLRRERETSDKSLFEQAQTAVDKSFKLAPDNLEGQKVQVAIMLGQHEFQRALTLALAINSKIPDDVLTYGYIADADIALGNYAEAEKAAQWMLDLRTHNVPGLMRGAELRQIYGDTEGALQFVSDAYQETSPDQSEDLAWMLTRMAELNLSTGKLDLAEQLVKKALTSFPDYYYSLEVLARIRNHQHEYQEAAELLHKRNEQFPQTASIYAESEAQEHAGNAEAAKILHAKFANQADGVTDQPDNDNRDLVRYYIAHEHNPAKALRISQLDVARTHDVWSLDSDATALFTSGKYMEALAQIEKAMAPGIRDASIFYHAAQISAALKKPSKTVGYLQGSLTANPNSEVSDSAREMLSKFSAPEYGKK